MKPVQLLPGDVLVHHWHPQALFEKLMNAAETWGEWADIPQDDLSANHVEIAYSQDWIFVENPPKARLYPVNEVPWDHVIVFRLDLSPYGIRQIPGNDLVFASKLQADINRHIGDPYDWNAIFRFGWIGLLARVWPGLAQRFLRDRTEAIDSHKQICSFETRDRLENAVNAAYPQVKGKFDLFNGGLGSPRPADFQISPYLRLVQGPR